MATFTVDEDSDLPKSNSDAEPTWDPSDETVKPDVQDPAAERIFFTRSIRFIKLLVFVSTFSIVLTAGVLSKATLLFMVSAIGTSHVPFLCTDTAGLERDMKYYMHFSVEEKFNWIWCLLLVLFVTEVLTFIRCARLCVFKKYQKPKISTFVVVLGTESLHTSGTFALLFISLPHLNAVDALCLTNAVAVVPSFLNTFSSWNSKSGIRSHLINAMNLASFLAQVSVVALLKKKQLYIWISISCFLVSFKWWQNFVSPSSLLGKIQQDCDCAKHFIYLFVSLWKVSLLFALCLLWLFLTGVNVHHFVELSRIFRSQNASIQLKRINDTFESDIKSVVLNSNALIVAGVHALSSYVCYTSGKLACKIRMQAFGYALPVCLTVPVTLTLIVKLCELKCKSPCSFIHVSGFRFWKCPTENIDFFYRQNFLFWIVWFVSQIWIAIHTWNPRCERMASTDKLFVSPMYCTALIDQSLAFNRRRNETGIETEARIAENKEDYPRIFACATMWHETLDEMEQLLKSVMRMDVHQCSQKAIQDRLGIPNPDFYELEVHIFFDDAFVISDEDDEKMTINNFVKDFVVAVDTAATKVYRNCEKPEPPIKVPTPYGGRLVWRLLGDNALVLHIKNKERIRHKKRWSQVMYMYYLLGYRLENRSDEKDIGSLLKNTFILALDGDIDFRPHSVQLLVDLMNRNKNLGAACGRIHPVGSGLMVYYQKFEYAIGHWLQKATEHMIGCVLCSPGCFSLFRAEALLKKNTVRRYATQSREAIEFVQFDQGEDRWLCTLLLQRGYRVEYSAASDAYTHCPETFAEFYTQRRRWAPSTMANIMDLLINYRETVQCNDNISRPYVAYQVLLMVGTILGPGTIFLMLVGAMVSAFSISNWQSFLVNLIPIVFFIIVCFYAKNDTQIMIAQILSALYALLMMAVLVGITLQLVVDGITSPSAIFILSMTASFLIAALAHPQEFWCVVHGILYFLSVPSMYLLLALYSFINLHVVSWGTREVQTKKSKKQMEAEMKASDTQKIADPQTGWMKYLEGLPMDSSKEYEGGFSFGLANLFRCLCCTYPKPDFSSLQIVKIECELKEMNRQISSLQKQIDGPIQRVSGFRKRSIHGLPNEQNLPTFPEEDELNEEESDTTTEQSGEVEEHTYNQPDNNEYWLQDKTLQRCCVKRLQTPEQHFWTELIEKYLYPLTEDPEEKAKVTRQLVDLRNKVVFGVLMLNALFILIVFLLQMQKDTLHVEWPLSSRGKANITYIARLNDIRIEMEYLQLEPINLVLVFFFTLILIIQFIAMLFHRFETLSHILASTRLVDKKPKDSEDINFTELTDLLQKQGLMEEDDDPSAPDVPDRTVPQDVVSLASERFLGKQRKFRSLSNALELNLQLILKNDPRFAHRVRRRSINPDAVNTLMRLTPSGSVRSNTVQSQLDFDTPTPSGRRLFFHPESDDDTESVRSIQMIDLTASRRTPILGEVRREIRSEI